MEKMLPDNIRKQVQGVLGAIQQPVEVAVLTSGQVAVPGQGKAGSQRSNICFLGIPGGYEFSTPLETLLMLGRGGVC